MLDMCDGMRKPYRDACGYRLLLLDQAAVRRMNAYARTHRLVVRVGGVTHEVVKLDGNSASLTTACEPTLGVLVDPDTIVYEHGEIDIDCMTCLVRRAWVS